MNLEGQIVAITGGFGSLGIAVAAAVKQAGGQAVLIDRVDAAKAHASAADSARLLLGGVDLGSGASAGEAFKRIGSELGGLDALVNVAGTFRWEKFEDGSVDTWDLLYDINLRTALNATRAALPLLLARGTGRIVNIGANNAAVKAPLGMGAYAASKAGVAKFTESLAEEVKDRGITVNAVLPSIIDTPPNRADMPDADFSRWVQPSQLADVIVFLLSKQAAAITGALIPVLGRV